MSIVTECVFSNPRMEILTNELKRFKEFHELFQTRPTIPKSSAPSYPILEINFFIILIINKHNNYTDLGIILGLFYFS